MRLENVFSSPSNVFTDLEETVPGFAISDFEARPELWKQAQLVGLFLKATGQARQNFEKYHDRLISLGLQMVRTFGRPATSRAARSFEKLIDVPHGALFLAYQNMLDKTCDAEQRRDFELKLCLINAAVRAQETQPNVRQVQTGALKAEV